MQKEVGKKQNTREVGTKYEERAAEYLCMHGYEIIKRNYRNSYGEIDILARKDSVLIFVEVKYRSTKSCGDPLEAVDKRKQKRISRTAFYYYINHGYETGIPCRFDVIAIYGDGRVKHIKNAFEFCP